MCFSTGSLKDDLDSDLLTATMAAVRCSAVQRGDIFISDLKCGPAVMVGHYHYCSLPFLLPSLLPSSLSKEFPRRVRERNPDFRSLGVTRARGTETWRLIRPGGAPGSEAGGRQLEREMEVGEEMKASFWGHAFGFGELHEFV